jgi:hypothetical protein
MIHTGGIHAYHSSSSFSHSSSKPSGIEPGQMDYLKTTTKARLSILILSKTYPTKRKYN